METQHNEQTPLLTVVRVAPPRQRYKHHRVRICCNFLLCLILIIGVFGFLFPLFFTAVLGAVEHITGRHLRASLPWAIPYPAGWPKSNGVSMDDLVEIVVNTPKAENIRAFAQHYTSGPHLAGKNLSLALWTREKWIKFGVEDTSLASYEVYLNYPKSHRLALYESSSNASLESSNQRWKVKYEARLEEDVLKEDSTTGLKDRVPTFHGYSASGNVTAQYVFVNYGTYEDYEDLVKAEVSLKGKIALAKYGANFRGIKVRRAQELGMVGVLIYSDPGDDENVTVEKGVAEYPKGKARQHSSVQRGSVCLLNRGLGDPTTPGYPSKPGVPRQDPGHETPKIPSLPISYEDALPLLKALNGHGKNVSSFNKYWQKGGLGYKGVQYNIGPSPKNLVINLVNEQKYETTPIWNVIGIINGTSSDEVVVVGNHRDAWIAGGAGDPNSGTAVLAEMVRSFGIALQTGWKPRRTIVFANWDGEEYALLGSSEWVEEYVPWLKGTAVAYLNVDVAVAGPKLTLSSNPLINTIVEDIITTTLPKTHKTSDTPLFKEWNGKFSTLGSGSDYAAFQHFAGVPSIDMGSKPTNNSAVYHYHSNYDSFHWMDTFGDPGWKYHRAMTQLWSTLTLAVAEAVIIPFKVEEYSSSIQRYISTIREKVEASGDDVEHFIAMYSRSNHFSRLEHAGKLLNDAAKAFDKSNRELRQKLDEKIPWWKWWQKVELWFQVQKANKKLKLFDRNFLYEPGLDQRNQFKHVIYAPGIWTGYSGVTLPGLTESIEAKNWTNAKRWMQIIEHKLDLARKSLD